MSRTSVQFFLCLTDSEPDLEKGKLYKVLLDESAAKSKHIRVVDESGEDYLYPAAFFVKLELPQQPGVLCWARHKKVFAQPPSTGLAASANT